MRKWDDYSAGIWNFHEIRSRYADQERTKTNKKKTDFFQVFAFGARIRCPLRPLLRSVPHNRGSIRTLPKVEKKMIKATAATSGFRQPVATCCPAHARDRLKHVDSRAPSDLFRQDENLLLKSLRGILCIYPSYHWLGIYKPWFVEWKLKQFTFFLDVKTSNMQGSSTTLCCNRITNFIGLLPYSK